MKQNRAFTLIELLVVIAIIALLIGILLPAIGSARCTAKNVLSQSRMRQLNIGAAGYAADNSDRIFSYSWRGPAGPNSGPVQFTLPNGKKKTVRWQAGGNDQEAASWQSTAILMNATGRLSGPTQFRSFTSRLPHRRYSHLVLLDYLTDTQPEQIAASPFDRNLLDWQADPDNYNPGSTIPYANGAPPEGYATGSNWTDVGVKQRWPFASSYQVVPAAWNTDGIGGSPTYTPVSDTPHLFTAVTPAPEVKVPLGNRRYNQVASPSGKVHMFEEFDWDCSGLGTYFAYPEAQCNLAFFDGSVRKLSTAEANPGWNPSTPNADWKQKYIPLDTFPPPIDGFDNNPEYCQRYRWTRYGLQGVDFGQKEVGRPRTLPDEVDADCGPS